MLLMQPVVAATAAWVILGETISSLQAVGGAMILAGLFIARRDELANKTR